MHLGYQQYKRFFRLFHPLLCYVNEQRQVVDEPFEPGSPDADELDAQDVLDELWADRSLIDAFVSDNPAGLGERDLAQVLQWKDAVDGYFVVVEHLPQFSVFLGDGFAFGVTGLGKDLARLIPFTPAPVRTALIPFDGLIVYASTLNLMNGRFGDAFDEIVEEGLDVALSEHPLVTTSEQLAAASYLMREEAGRREIEEMLEELEDTSDPEHPGGLTAPHIHRGRLAGLAEDEREALVREDFRKASGSGDLYLDILDERSWKHAPTGALVEVVALRTKDDLARWARDLGLKGVSSLKKAELAAAVAEELVAQSESMFQLANRCSDREYVSLRAVYDAGGRVERDRKELLDQGAGWDVRLLPLSPALNAFAHGDTVTFSIPDELRAVMDGWDWKAIEKERLIIQRAMHCANVYAELLGVVGIHDLWDLYAKHYPDGLDRPDFFAFLLAVYDDFESEFDLWGCDGELHVVHYSLTDDFDDLEPGLDSWSDEFDDDLTDGEAFRRYLVKRHREVPIKPVEEEFDGYDPFEAKMRLPAVKALRDFLDEHVPDGQDDLYFAERILEEVESMVQFECGPEDYLDFFDDEGLSFGSTSKTNQLLTLVSNAANDMPHWTNNGWSPLELLEQSTGHKVFRNSDGSVRKVGRNEPCPCGSGKKYKKCCGC